jgi:hypothetical protein
MFITNKQNIAIPEFINISGNNVKVVTEFKLFGIIIDNNLNFKSNTAKIKRSINIRLYSIQKLFQLPLAVKIQFLFISSFYPIHLKIYKRIVINEIIHFRFGKYKKYIKENSNILHLKTN